MDRNSRSALYLVVSYFAGITRSRCLNDDREFLYESFDNYIRESFGCIKKNVAHELDGGLTSNGDDDFAEAVWIILWSHLSTHYFMVALQPTSKKKK